MTAIGVRLAAKPRFISIELTPINPVCGTMSMSKAIRREGCKHAFSRCLMGLALAAVAVSAGRVAVVIGNAAHREATGPSNTGSISHDRPAQKASFTSKQI